MSTPVTIGLDIGGTKIAGAAFDENGAMLHQEIVSTPTQNYDAFLDACTKIVTGIELRTQTVDRFGVCVTGLSDKDTGAHISENIPCIQGKRLRDDLVAVTSRDVRTANDCDCAALAEAIDGAGKGYRTVMGLIMGTGIGGGIVVDGRIWAGANNLAGEIGHLPMPFRQEGEGVGKGCICGQDICIEAVICGAGLVRLYETITGKKANNPQIATLAITGDRETLAVLDRYYEMVAKAMITIIHSFDPEVIVVSGGLNSLPGLYEAVPAKWGKYCLAKTPRTKFLPAKHGAIAGLRGAAGLWNDRLFEA